MYVHAGNKPMQSQPPRPHRFAPDLPMVRTIDYKPPAKSGVLPKKRTWLERWCRRCCSRAGKAACSSCYYVLQPFVVVVVVVVVVVIMVGAIRKCVLGVHVCVCALDELLSVWFCIMASVRPRRRCCRPRPRGPPLLCPPMSISMYLPIPMPMPPCRCKCRCSNMGRDWTV